ncbi:MAG TPA: ATP-binding cassette domain-containing protein, partial [Burkholderiales bacterium]|nr:ATP-binding cassette domain-containing protein [Burkholderiales bacterium]
MSKIIEIKNVSAYRGDTPVFRGLSLEIATGCNTVILGPNGAGKTTLLKLLAREIYPVDSDASFIKIFGRERWNIWELRAHLGIVSHDLQREYAGYASGMDVILSGFYSSVGVWAHQQFSDAQRTGARRVLELLGIDALKDKLYAAMSTGEQRRFLLGRALVNDPDTLVLDEPTSGLDLKACFQYLDTIRTLMRGGKTVILVTHHLHEIPPEVTHAILLKGGRVIAAGEKAQILTDRGLTDLFDTPIELV